jgi:hypothetical protein
VFPDGVAHATVADGALTVADGAAPRADARIEGTEEALIGVLLAPPGAPRGELSIRGDVALAESLLAACAIRGG